ncbi:acyl-CoA dehydrogenase family protein [Streptomyces sp. NPDC002889]|uniref:acyl-CoA dehydrogenase family protein n=1 Tax=Streptomyces sp. NPDC002889 TaxID=3364669 RepID=UPI0036915C8E
MRFVLTGEQQAFAHSLDRMLTAAGTPSAARAWAAGDPAPGRVIWGRLAEAGVFALTVPEAYEGLGALPVELVVAFVELGRHAVPGPVVETVAATVLLTQVRDAALAGRLLPGIAAGELSATVRLPGSGPYALDADLADCVLVVADPGPSAEPGDGGADRDDGDVRAGRTAHAAPRAAPELRLAPGHGQVRTSADPVRRTAVPLPGGEVLAAGPEVAAAAGRAGDWARLATAAQALGVGLALLDRTVAYVRRRTQFGTAIGSFQAVKHRLADTLIGLEFARPLVYAAALSMDTADIAAAKVAAGEAAYAAARTALQLHGAVGYTEELDLSLWLRKARPLRDAWGTPAQCRAAVLA